MHDPGRPLVAALAAAGAALARRMGTIGYLARELPEEIPALIRSLQRRGRLKPKRRSPRE